MLPEISHAVLEKRKKMVQGIPRQLCRPQEDLVNVLLELLAFNISIPAPYFSGISRMQTCEHNLEFGEDKRDAPLRAVIPRGLSSTPGTSCGPGGLSQEPPAGFGPCSSKGNQEESVSHAGPPAQLLTSFHFSLTCCFGDSCSPVILGLIVLGFPPCTC